MIFHPGTPVTRLLGRWGHEAAVAAGVRLVSVNRPGYGGSTTSTGPPSLLAVGEDTAALASHLGLDGYAAVGVGRRPRIVGKDVIMRRPSRPTTLRARHRWTDLPSPFLQRQLSGRSRGLGPQIGRKWPPRSRPKCRVSPKRRRLSLNPAPAPHKTRTLGANRIRRWNLPRSERIATCPGTCRDIARTRQRRLAPKPGIIVAPLSGAPWSPSLARKGETVRI